MTIQGVLLCIVLPIVVGASLSEAFVLSRREGYDWRSLGISLVDLLVRVPMNAATHLGIAMPVAVLAWHHRLTTLPLNAWWVWVALFITTEFTYYWYHRCAHRMRLLWVNHAVHHSSNQLNLSAAYRLGWLGKLTGTVLFFIPVIWLGFPLQVVGAALSLNLLYQFWIHATWIPRLGILEGVINTPSAHRVHHATNLDYLDANFGGVLLVFDRLFGTYRAERPDCVPRYGLVQPILSYNPLRVEFTLAIALLRDLAVDLRHGRLLAAWGHLMRPPGWSADGPGRTTEDLRLAASAG